MDYPSQQNNVSIEKITSQKSPLDILNLKGFFMSKITKTNFILKKLNAALKIIPYYRLTLLASQAELK